MKTLTKLLLAAAMLTTVVSAKAEWVSGYYRSSGTYVQPYYRSSASSYTYARARFTSCTPGYATYNYSSTTYPSDSSSSYSVYGSSTQFGGTTFHNYYSSDGGSLSGTTLTIGNTSYTSLYEY